MPCEDVRHDSDNQLMALYVKLTNVRVVLADIDSGVHATKSRDYGRGLAHAAKLIRQAIGDQT